MAGRQWVERVWRQTPTAAGMLSLHVGDPGDTGQAMLDGPFALRPSDLTVQRGVLTNVRQLDVGPVRVGGRVRYAGLWTRDRLFIAGVPLRLERQLIAGQTVLIPRGALRLELG